VTSLLPVTWHPALDAVLVALSVAYVAVTRRTGLHATRVEAIRFAGAILVLLAAYGWPLGDLAAHVSLAALVLQRLLVLLAGAPLLMSALPGDLVTVATRPPVFDRLVVACSRPAVAVVLVTVVGTASLTPSAVAWATASTAPTVLLGLVNLALGVVLWLPVLSRVPGTHHLSSVAKGIYLLVASLVVTALSIVWIFAQHPMYGSFHGQREVLGISPILDQQLAGFLSKVVTYGPMWTVAFIFLARTSGEESPGPSTLRWADVQRELERHERRQRSVSEVSEEP
jgi:cytochrome c oxidase assembly factor CtaG